MDSSVPGAGEPSSRLRCAFVEQLETAIGQLAGPGLETTQIHEARKRLKHARAILRLLRAGLTSSSYRRADHTVRDAARLLSATRDDDVLIQLIDALTLQPAAKQAELALSGLREKLLKRHERKQLPRRRRHLQTIGLLRDAMDQSQAWTITSEVALAWDGLRRTYGKGRNAYRAAINGADDNKLHAWRKQAQYLRYQLESLATLTQQPINKRAKHLARLGHILGDDHDLALLHAAVREVRTSTPSEHSMAALDEVIRHLRRKLQREAFSLGASLYKARPKRFAKHFRPPDPQARSSAGNKRELLVPIRRSNCNPHSAN